MEMENDIAQLKESHILLQSVLQDVPEMGELIFQGRSLSYHATQEGFEAIVDSLAEQKYDKIALNHGIRRLMVGGFDGEIIWDHPAINKRIIRSDKIISELENNFREFQAEVKNCLDSLQKFPDSDTLTNDNGLWSYVPFYNKDGTAVESMHQRCPIISQYLSTLDVNTILGFVFISSVSSRTRIFPHNGSTSLRQRYHFGLEIPDNGTSQIRIGDCWVKWQEGKAFGFNDAVNHEVVHDAEGTRTLLIIDVWADGVPENVKKCLKENPGLLKYATIQNSNESIAIND